MKGAKKTHGGHRRELLQPLHNRHPVIADVYFDAIDEDIKTARDEGGVKVSKCHHCRKVFHGREVDSLVQGRLEHPRNTLHIQRDCFPVQSGHFWGGGDKPVIPRPGENECYVGQHPAKGNQQHPWPKETKIHDQRTGHLKNETKGDGNIDRGVPGFLERSPQVNKQATAEGGSSKPMEFWGNGNEEFVDGRASRTINRWEDGEEGVT